MDQDGRQDVRDLFTRHGIRYTRQREELYAALVASKAHPTAEELYQTVRGVQPNLSLATVYNTLEVFTRRGLCRRFAAAGGGAGPARYDGDLSNHVHLVTDDGRIRDVPDDLGEAVMAHIPADLIAAIERRMGVRIDRLSVNILAAARP